MKHSLQKSLNIDNHKSLDIGGRPPNTLCTLFPLHLHKLCTCMHYTIHVKCYEGCRLSTNTTTHIGCLLTSLHNQIFKFSFTSIFNIIPVHYNSNALKVVHPNSSNHIWNQIYSRWSIFFSDAVMQEQRLLYNVQVLEELALSITYKSNTLLEQFSSTLSSPSLESTTICKCSIHSTWIQVNTILYYVQLQQQVMLLAKTVHDPITL